MVNNPDGVGGDTALITNFGGSRPMPSKELLGSRRDEMVAGKQRDRFKEIDENMAKKGYDSRAIANIFVEKSQENGNWLTIIQLVKLVYIAHGWTLGYTGDPLIHHKVQAWRYGPVVPEVYKTFRLQGTLIRSRAEGITGKFYEAELSKEEEEIVDGVYDQYSVLPPFTLSDITHREGTPWSKYSEPRYQTIPNEEIHAYYKKIVDRMKSRGNDGEN